VVADEQMRVFIGGSEGALVPAAVLEYTIRKHAGGPVEVAILGSPPATAASADERRSWIEASVADVTGGRGRALYLEAAAQVFADVAELWALPPGNGTAPGEPRAGHRERTEHPAVMMIDLSRSDSGAEPRVIDDVSVEWDSVEHYDPDTTRLVHYAALPVQPWRNGGNPLRELWLEAFRETLAAAALDPELVLRGIAAGHVDPALRAELHYHPGWSEHADRAYTKLERANAKLDKAKARLAESNARAVNAERGQKQAKKRLRSMERSPMWRIRSSVGRGARRLTALGRGRNANRSSGP